MANITVHILGSSSSWSNWRKKCFRKECLTLRKIAKFRPKIRLFQISSSVIFYISVSRGIDATVLWSFALRSHIFRRQDTDHK